MAEKDTNSVDISKTAKKSKQSDSSKSKAKESGFQRFIRKAKGVMGERKKIHWPTKKQLRNNTAIVIAMVVFVGVFVWGVDSLMAILTNFMISG